MINNNKKGKIMIEYYSEEELERLIELLGSMVINRMLYFPL